MEILHGLANTATNQFLLYFIRSNFPARISYKYFDLLIRLLILKLLHVRPYCLQFDSRETFCDMWLIHHMIYCINYCAGCKVSWQNYLLSRHFLYNSRSQCTISPNLCSVYDCLIHVYVDNLQQPIMARYLDFRLNDRLATTT